MSCSHKSFHYCFLILLFCSCYSGFGQRLSSGSQVLTFFSEVDDTEQPYGLYLPDDYNPQKKYPLVVMLHGAGSNHRLALRRVFGKSNLPDENDVEASRYFPDWEPVEYIVVSPYARGTAGYQGVPEKDVYDVLEDVKKRFSVDEDRIYLTGLSMGGGGTLWLGLTRPDVWAAIAPVCPAPPNGTEDLADNAFNYPVHFFHGEVDPVVPVAVSRNWVENLKGAGIDVTYSEFPGVQHDSWVNAYEDEYIFKWFEKFRRNNYPDEVRYSTRQYKYNKAYWVELDELNSGGLATIVARFTSPNHITVETTGLFAFTLSLTGHPKFESGEPLQLKVDGKKLKTTGREKVSLLRKDGKWLLEAYKPTLTTKQKGLEGPIREAFADRHVYVYGTQGNPTKAELEARIHTANEAANWSVYRGGFLGRYMVFPRVVADKDLRQSDRKNANLILFGTRETNSIIEQHSSQLPIHLDPEMEDYGLFYIYPVDNRYVVINSGLPWWQQEQVQGFNFLPQNLAALPTFKDFILFKNNLNNKVSEGYFDKNWGLGETDKERLKDSGIVNITQ